MSADPELLVGMSIDELEALADTLLAPAAQHRLDDLLARQKEKQLTAGEEQELDRLLQKLNQLTILKTRARYTLNHKNGETDSPKPEWLDRDFLKTYAQDADDSVSLDEVRRAMSKIPGRLADDIRAERDER
jgi:hypothetical protein